MTKTTQYYNTNLNKNMCLDKKEKKIMEGNAKNNKIHCLACGLAENEC
jgi:hypothetical protein